MRTFDAARYVGKKYGRLLVTGVVRVPVKDKTGRVEYFKSQLVCVCDCGTERVLGPHPLVHGVRVSCGCKRTEHVRTLAESRVVHGQAKRADGPEGRTSLYASWGKIRNLCARGVRMEVHRVCHEYDPRWEDFEEFFKDFGSILATETIRRRDRKLTWCKENCYIGPGQRTQKQNAPAQKQNSV